MFTTKGILLGSAILIFFGLKFLFRNLDHQQLLFLLIPTNFLVELMTGSASFFSIDNGFYYPEIAITIDKSCSGYNFWLLVFLIVAFLMTKYYQKGWKVFFIIPASLLFSLILTYFVNASRIFVSIFLQRKMNIFEKFSDHIVHESIGVFINLFFMILVYWLIEKVLIQFTEHEKPA